MAVPNTKLRLPVPHRRLVDRARLVDRLPGAGHAPARLVLIAAPAGFGKTTLLTQWLSGAPSTQNVAWLGLDERDSDLRTFLVDLVAAIRMVEPNLGAVAHDILEAGGASPGHDVLVSLVNELDLVAAPLVVALDDYHVVESASVHEAVAFLLDNLPSQVTLAMTTRVDPPFPLARWRARGELAEVRAADLRFTEGEATAFLNDVMGLQLTPDLVAALEQRTDGWAAGLQLAAVSVRGHTDGRAGGSVADFVDAFSGSNRYVIDYLVEEVLDRLPADVGRFLIWTSVLDRLTGDLCDALTGRTDGAQMLDALERDNVPIIPLDHDRRWYRSHQLLTDALRVRLAARADVQVASLHAAASRWLAAHGMLLDAVRHSVQSSDHEYAADLVELALPELRRHRQDHMMREWLTKLPDDVIERRPLLATFVGWRRLSDGDLDGMERWLSAAERGLSAVPDLGVAMTNDLAPAFEARAMEIRSLAPMIEVYRASVAQGGGDVEGTVTHAQRALALAAPDDHFPRAAAAGFIGLAAWAVGDVVTAVDRFGDTVAGLHAAGLAVDELAAVVTLADMWMARGDANIARSILEDGIERAERRSGAALPPIGDLHVAAATVLVEHGDLDGAARHLDRADELGERATLLENRFRRFTARAALLRATGDLDGAVAMLDAAEPVFRAGYLPDIRPIAASRTRLWIAQGRLADARRWARDRGIDPSDPADHPSEHDQLTLARLLIAEGRPAETFDLLDRVVVASEQAGRVGSLIEAKVVTALALRADHDGARASEALAYVLRLGVPRGFRRIFVDDGTPMTDMLTMLARGAQDRQLRAHADRVLTTARAASPALLARHGSIGRPGLVDELSDRELDVLRLLASELSGPEIARHLYISLNTLRTHSKRIYTKLQVTTRRAAVRRAGELGLL